MKQLFDYFALEGDYPDLDASGAVARLSKAIQCKTVNHVDTSRTDFSAFDTLQAHMKASYPHIMASGTFEVIGHSVLITIPGSDPALRPCLYMSHQDVVPVVEGTEGDWTYDAFSGTVADGYIWGRGTLDIKQQVFGTLEAAEYLLAHGRTFARMAYLAFGEDEETLNQGARVIAKTLQDRGVTLEFLLDEGGGKLEEGSIFGAPGVAISQIHLMEKGYANLELSVRSAGGHSSRPFGGTSLGRLSQAIADITRAPAQPKLTPVVEQMFRAVAPHVTQEPLKSLVADIPGNGQALANHCMDVPELFPFVVTTVAPTVIRGSSAAYNVMPQDMQAVINFRVAEGDTCAAVLERCRATVADRDVEMKFLQDADDPSHTARIDGLGYDLLVRAMNRYYPEVVFIPSAMVGATDARHYEGICDTCLRCTPFLVEAQEATAGVHGTNERIPVRSYIQGIRVLIRLMEEANLA